MPANWAGKSFECTDGIEAEDTSVFDLWQAAGHDCAPDMEWYTKQTVLGAVYTTTELYMLTDDTARCKTWNWINIAASIYNREIHLLQIESADCYKLCLQLSRVLVS